MIYMVTVCKYKTIIIQKLFFYKINILQKFNVYALLLKKILYIFTPN